MDTVSNRLVMRLVTITTMTVPPQHMAVIPVTPSSHSLCSTNFTAELIEVTENPLLHIKQPHLCVIDTLHKFYDKHQSKCITLTVDVSDEELRINKGITICFAHTADVTELHHDTELTESFNEINDVNIEMNESGPYEVTLKETVAL